ncbi:MAG TPA: 3-deoxy-7-phosphoheptulonate synthase [Candidatus Wujingus californicus]|uniref:3-deoxy-7-phosphoheptulonate synthase n=1 Tax=Candidatus Wujingus californicus TaxID=3367618 RepID=UPI001D27689C|nr:3-deoxy-7-phosphoheptulonate synthase [Planctomycetota bacterium]MDO8131251.1 3-deoxy-7-phosphoheptulonate synthase [Candidatus Brocadiales bacterium]
MIIVMKPECTKKDINYVIESIEKVGLKGILLQGTNRNVIAIIGDERVLPADFWDVLPGVEKSVPILAPYKLASKEGKDFKTVVHLGNGKKVGGDQIAVIAGPCAIESKEQIIEIAKRVRDAGATALRGGAFKPRSNPYTFQGLQEEGLVHLARAREEVGLPIVTEVLTPEHVKLVCKYSDILQIGTRNMQNFLLLRAVGESGKPVILKRGMSATVEEFLLAAEYVLAQNNPNVILCERGIRTFETHTRFTLSLSIVPLLREMTHLPVIVDPSHGTGKRSLVNPMSKGSIAVGADGLLIETHPEPEKSFVDGPQTITLEAFDNLMQELKPVAEAVGRKI